MEKREEEKQEKQFQCLQMRQVSHVILMNGSLIPRPHTNFLYGAWDEAR